MDDLILPFQLDNAPVRGRLIRLGAALNDILMPHAYPDGLARLTGEAAVLALTVSSLLKYDGIFTLQAQGEGGPVSMIVADATSTGELRACINLREGEEAPDSDDLPEVIGKGYMAFTVDQGPQTERYQGIVELKDTGLRDSLVHYFTQSEQIPTGILTAVRQTDAGWRGAALVLQHMPEEGGHAGLPKSQVEEDDWRRVMMLLQSCTEEELLGPDLAPNDLLFRLFHEETVRVFDPQAIRKGCRCSDSKLRKILAMMPQNDLDYMEDKGTIGMRCEFCSRDFTFTREEIHGHKDHSGD